MTGQQQQQQQQMMRTPIQLMQQQTQNIPGGSSQLASSTASPIMSSHKRHSVSINPMSGQQATSGSSSSAVALGAMHNQQQMEALSRTQNRQM